MGIRLGLKYCARHSQLLCHGSRKQGLLEAIISRPICFAVVVLLVTRRLLQRHPRAPPVRGVCPVQRRVREAADGRRHGDLREDRLPQSGGVLPGGGLRARAACALYPKTRSARMPTTGAPNDATRLSKHMSRAYAAVLAFSGTTSAKIGLPGEAKNRAISYLACRWECTQQEKWRWHRLISLAGGSRAPGDSDAQEQEPGGVRGTCHWPSGPRRQQQESGQRDGGRVGHLRQCYPARVGEPPRREVAGESREQRAKPRGRGC